MMKLKGTLLVCFCVILILLLVSCQLKTEPSIATVTEKAQFDIILETVTVVSSSATIVKETATPSPMGRKPTSTATVTLTPIPSQTAMPTLWPTLSPDEATNKVLTLLNDTHNPNCLLPCWWGAVPGQTQWHDISPYLESFALNVHSFPEQSAFVAEFHVPESVDYTGKLNIGYEINALEMIANISIASVNTEGYDPQTMMALYGVPDEVWLKTFSDYLPGGVLPFHLIIVYQEQGISFRYYAGASRTEEIITICFESGVVEVERPDLFPAGPRIYLWEPGHPKPIDEIAYVPGEIYYPLEDRTDLTPQTFYEKFTNPDESPCIETPSELWND